MANQPPAAAPQGAPTRTVFCPAEQKDTPHEITVQPNLERVLTCKCGHFVKFHQDATKEQMHAYLDAYSKANKGQVPAAKVEADLREAAAKAAADLAD